MPQLSEWSHSIATPYSVFLSAGNQTIHFFVPAGTRRLSLKSRVCTFYPSPMHSKQLLPTYRSDISRRAQQWPSQVSYLCVQRIERNYYVLHTWVLCSTNAFTWTPISDQIALHSFMELGSYMFQRC